MAKTVILMRAGKFGEAEVNFVAGVIGVEITGGFLGGDDVSDEGIEVALELGAGRIGGFVGSEGPSGGFDPLVEIGICVERTAAGEIRTAFEAAEVIDDAMLFEKEEERGEAALSDDAAAGGPKAIADMDGLHGDGMLAGVGRIIEENDTLLIPGR
jgi:hypothetical protein